ncbi:uncharacterized protein LOC131670606 [Phymastichus coffea]|uniref:uncharacterized protein LOC131670606 n=1 Tax=Phymastichus coffea TaxID=108790 RepID=UPI00273C2BEB|nr:uncharacterized protein LOC131670606 [Phymastichus coffea]
MKCCVKFCESKSTKISDIRFHHLPRPNDGFVNNENYFGKIEKISRLKAWQKALGLGNNYSKSFVVCSLHFKKNDYLLPVFQLLGGISCKNLKKNVVPTQNLPVKKIIPTNRSLRKQQRANIQKTKVNNQTVATVQSSASQPFDQESNLINTMDIPDYNSSLETILKVDAACEAKPVMRDAVCYIKPVIKDVSLETQTMNVISFIKNDSALSTMTGLQSFTLLKTIVEILEKCFTSKEFEKSSLDTTSKVIMTYMKLKQNMSYSALGILFQMSRQHCQRIFEKTIVMLRRTLQVMIDWPSRSTISKNLPSCFKGYEDVRVILDCTEIHIQHTKCLDCQMSTYSQYKGGLTAKFMTGVSPSGSITFVSKMYGGKSSDTAIFNQSDLIQLLERGDAVMVDKGFLIEGTCEKNGWKLYRPSYLRDKQLSRVDTDKSCEIAKARVHIERSNQGLKVYQILSSMVPCEVHKLLQDIFIVICATVNLSSPIIADSNFMKNSVDEHIEMEPDQRV